MRRALVLAGLVLIAGCSQSDSYDAQSADVALSEQVASLSARIDRLENEVAAEKEQQAVQVQQRAVLLGSTASGAPIQREFSSMGTCEQARIALIQEGQRACQGRDVSDSTPSRIYGPCPKPQAACSTL